MSNNAFLSKLKGIADADVAKLFEAEKSYGDSWKKRGGVGAFMMLARKWDRIENQIGIKPDLTKLTPGERIEYEQAASIVSELNAKCESSKFGWDIFKAAIEDQRKEGLIDDIRDLRTYLMLVEAELQVRGLHTQLITTYIPESQESST